VDRRTGWPPVGLDPDHHLHRRIGVPGDQLVQPGHPGRDPLASQHPTVSGHHAHGMVALCPVDPDQQHRCSPAG
jgi:hypothetical protein